MPYRSAAIAGSGGVACIVFAAFAFGPGTRFPGTAALVPVTGTCLVIVAGFAQAGAVPVLLGVSAAVFIGDLSYSWYLWHWPFIVFGRSLLPNANSHTDLLFCTPRAAPGLAVLPTC
jgi:peptidoglycan/LPS O-acetylase OafA/YrhL